METQDRVRIENRRPALVTLPTIKAGQSKFLPHGAPSRGLYPGVNIVDAAYASAIMEHRGVRRAFDAKHGCLRIVKTGDPFIPENAGESLMGTSVENAIGLVNSCQDERQLDRWVAGDTRGEVHRAIAARLASLKKSQGGKPEEPNAKGAPTAA